MKALWIAVGAGALIAIAGLAVMTVGRNYNLGVLLMLGGLVVAVLGGVLRLVSAFMDERGIKEE